MEMIDTYDHIKNRQRITSIQIKLEHKVLKLPHDVKKFEKSSVETNESPRFHTTARFNIKIRGSF
jgi:hypothetical protein